MTLSMLFMIHPLTDLINADEDCEKLHMWLYRTARLCLTIQQVATLLQCNDDHPEGDALPASLFAMCNVKLTRLELATLRRHLTDIRNHRDWYG